MRKILILMAATLLAGTAWAHNCPNEMKAIDAKLATKPSMPRDALDKVAKLRKEGETMHSAGKHAESMKALGEAKKILGI
jgi:hypothetical protein